MSEKLLRLRRYQTKYFKSESLKQNKMTMEWYQKDNPWASPQCSWCYRYMQPMDIIGFADDINDKTYIFCNLCMEALKNENAIEFDYNPYLKNDE